MAGKETGTFTPATAEITSVHYVDEIVKSLEPVVAKSFDILLPEDGKRWTPADFLPDMSSPGWEDRIREFQEISANLPTWYFVILAVNTATEEALPSYEARLQQYDSIRDQTGTDQTPYARGSREWTAQEYFHGELLMGLLNLSARIDMNRLYITNANLIRNGFNMNVINAIMFRLWTAGQERVTKKVHGKMANVAQHAGATPYHKGQAVITGHESNHERYYEAFNKGAFHIAPESSMLSLAELVRRGMIMPTRLIDDEVSRDENGQPDLFERYGRLAWVEGIYTPADYAEVIGHMIEAYGIKNLSLSGDAARAQQYVLDKFEQRLRVAQEYDTRRIKRPDPESFSFIVPRPEPLRRTIALAK